MLDGAQDVAGLGLDGRGGDLRSGAAEAAEREEAVHAGEWALQGFSRQEDWVVVQGTATEGLRGVELMHDLIGIEYRPSTTKFMPRGRGNRKHGRAGEEAAGWAAGCCCCVAKLGQILTAFGFMMVSHGLIIILHLNPHLILACILLLLVPVVFDNHRINPAT